MINLLIGPLAEAKHVALRDGEQFNARLINLDALHNYGGSSDLEKVYECLDIFIASGSRHEEKLSGLFAQAFQFIILLCQITHKIVIPAGSGDPVPGTVS